MSGRLGPAGQEPARSAIDAVRGRGLSDSVPRISDLNGFGGQSTTSASTTTEKSPHGQSQVSSASVEAERLFFVLLAVAELLNTVRFSSLQSIIHVM